MPTPCYDYSYVMPLTAAFYSLKCALSKNRDLQIAIATEEQIQLISPMLQQKALLFRAIFASFSKLDFFVIWNVCGIKAIT